jgi:hypothetical protein
MLSHCPELPVSIVRDADGVTWCLAGLAQQSEPGRADPLPEIQTARTGEVPTLYRSWAGRWILLGRGEVHLDAAGLLGSYYLHRRNGCWISTSVALLPRLSEAGEVERDPRELHQGRGFDWIPAPASRYVPIRRLLPSQVLDTTKGSTRPRPWLRPIRRDIPYPQIIDQLAARLTEPLRRLKPGNRTVWVPLTGGRDSRLVLALATEVGIPVRAYTNERRMTLADRFLPRRIARVMGVPYEFHRPGAESSIRGSAYDAHGADSTAGIDRSYYTKGQWDFGQAGDYVLRGGGFETGRAYYYAKLPALSSPSLTGSSIAAAFNERSDSPAAGDLDAWLRAVQTAPIRELDWRDRFYLEQRLSGWLSAIEQELDITGRERFYVVNADDTYRLLLALPEAVRREGQHHIDLIERLAPELLAFPFNPTDESFGGRLTLLLQWLGDDPRGLLDEAWRRLSKRSLR